LAAAVVVVVLYLILRVVRLAAVALSLAVVYLSQLLQRSFTTSVVRELGLQQQILPVQPVVIRGLTGTLLLGLQLIQPQQQT
jgi:hypothetical protein